MIFIKKGDYITYSALCTTRPWFVETIVSKYFPAKVIRVEKGRWNDGVFVVFSPKSGSLSERRWNITNVMLEEEEN